MIFVTGSPIRSILICFLAFIFCGLGASLDALAVEIADTPLEIHINEAPPLLMFILDDSGSMDSEFMTPEPGGRPDGRYYLFPDAAYEPQVDHTFGSGQALTSEQSRDWRTQWSGYNRIFFDPAKAYVPWPATAAHRLPDADIQRPLSDPLAGDTDGVRCRMADAYFSVFDSDGNRVTVPLAHYFTTLDGNPDAPQSVYLVAWQDGDGDGAIDLGLDDAADQRRYYHFQDDGDHIVEDNELTPVADPSLKMRLMPGVFDGSGRLIRRQSDAESLQCFVNWFSYHRRREFVLKAFVARALRSMQGTLVGLYALNNSPRLAVQAVNLPRADLGDSDGENGVVDRSETLLDALYQIDSRGGTPLRLSLDQVGRYFHRTLTSDLGPSPFYAATAGGGCQRAYAVIISDGYWNDAFSGVGNVDGNQGKPYADAWSDTLADIALTYYKTDLASDLPDALTARGCEDIRHQHMVIHTVSLGIDGTIDPTDIDADGSLDQPGYFDDPCFKDVRTPRPDWPQPFTDGAAAADDLWHAAVNGRGRYFKVDRPQALAQALADIAAQFEGNNQFASSVAVNGPVLRDRTVVYQASYRPGQWTGDLRALGFGDGSGMPTTIWSAAEQLGSAAITADDRRIVTYGGIWPTDRGVAFRYDDLSAGQQQALGSDLFSGSEADNKARDLLDYLRGEALDPFRIREGLLGDIVHSAPMVVDQTVFVGANDGMLHAFDTASGQERFAYVPALVFDELKALSQGDYDIQHRFFVDATPSIGEVRVSEYRRRRYLVGGLGKGGKGYFCLLIGDMQRHLSNGELSPYETVFNVDDVGDRTLENDVADLVLWEYPRPDTGADDMDNDGNGLVDETGETDPDMGFSLGQGYAVNANTGGDSFRSVVIFGNGYNSDSGRAVLFVVDADTGTLVHKIDTGVDGDNGLSTPALVDVNLDRRVDYAYAGDLKGNLWKFDLTADNIFDWGVAYGEDRNGNGRIDARDGDIPRPLFQTSGQPITARPDIMRARGLCAADAPGYIVLIGTGKFLGHEDVHDTSRQSIYALWDYGDDGDDSEYLGHITDRETGQLSSGLCLMPREVVGRTSMDGSAVRILSNNRIDFSLIDDSMDGDGLAANNDRTTQSPDPLAEAGWFFDFPEPPDPMADPGERVIDNVVVRGGNALVVSYAPDTAPCAGGGVSWIYLLSGCTGNSQNAAEAAAMITPMTAKRSFGRLNLSPVVIKTVSQMALDQVLLSDVSGRIFLEAFQGEGWGKVYWRENSD